MKHVRTFCFAAIKGRNWKHSLGFDVTMQSLHIESNLWNCPTVYRKKARTDLWALSWNIPWLVSFLKIMDLKKIQSNLFIPAVDSKKQQVSNVNHVADYKWMKTLLRKIPCITHAGSSGYSKLLPQHRVEHVIETGDAPLFWKKMRGQWSEPGSSVAVRVVLGRRRWIWWRRTASRCGAPVATYAGLLI